MWNWGPQEGVWAMALVFGAPGQLWDLIIPWKSRPVLATLQAYVLRDRVQVCYADFIFFCFIFNIVDHTLNFHLLVQPNKCAIMGYSWFSPSLSPVLLGYLCNSGPDRLYFKCASFLVPDSLAPTSLRRRALFAPQFPVGSVHGELAPRQKQHGGSAWWRKAAHPIAAKK